MKHKSISLQHTCISEQNVILAADNDHQCVTTITFIFFAILVDLPLHAGEHSQLRLKKSVLVTEVR